MRRAHYVRGALGVILTGLVGSTGCTHNYYYGGVPTACAPGTTTIVPGSIQYGSVCRSYRRGSSAAGPSWRRARSPILGRRHRPVGSRVVVQRAGQWVRPSWRRSDPESNLAARTRVEGALRRTTPPSSNRALKASPHRSDR